MHRLALALLLTLAACAHADGDGCRASFEPRPQPESPLEHDPGTAAGMATSAAICQAGEEKSAC